MQLKQLDQLPPPAIWTFSITWVWSRSPERVRLGAGAGNYDLGLLPELDRLNFHELPVGTSFGFGRRPPTESRGEARHEVTERFFEIKTGKLCRRRGVVPAMITLHLGIIRQDCLCYLMERYPL